MSKSKTVKPGSLKRVVGLRARLDQMLSEAEDIYVELRVRKMNRAAKNCETARCWLVAVKDNVPRE